MQELPLLQASAAGWSSGYCNALTPHGWRWIVNAHHNDGKRFIVEPDELLRAFLEMERVVHGSVPLLHKWE
jgi:hypothetical protein